VKVVDFDVCQNAPKLTGYHSNVPYATTKFYASSVIPIHVTTYAERLTKIGLVITEIFCQICRFLLSRPTRCSCYPRNLWGYWTKCHQNCTQCREINSIKYFEIRIVILQSVSEWQCHKGDWPIFRSTVPSSACKVFSCGEKIAKIDPVHPEIFDETSRTMMWTRNAISIDLFSAETTGTILTKILHDIVALVVLFNLAHTWCYPILFLNACAGWIRPSATRALPCQNGAGLSQRRHPRLAARLAGRPGRPCL